MEPTKRSARNAGLLYVIVVLAGLVHLMYVPSQIIVWKDAARTYENIVASEGLFRWGIVAGIVLYTAFLILPLALYRLLQHVNKPAAIAMVALSTVSVPFSLSNLLYEVNILTLIEKPGNVPLEEIQSQVLLQLHHYNNGIQLSFIFWGLWLLPFGYLVYTSGFLPKFLGIFLMAGCFGYLINFFGNFLFDDYRDLGIERLVALPSRIGEMGICLWLLIVGIRQKS